MKTRITIISGFLGSGKTTLLKRFLDWEFSRGVTPRVIMSEFGDFDIDGQIIADERLQVMAVTGGCICCSNRDELANAVTKMLKASSITPVYIETTGVADPAGVLQAIHPLLGDTGFISKVLVVYDASRHGKDGRDAILIERQLMTADWIILNKTDLTPGDVERIAAEVAQVNPQAKIVKAVACNIELDQATEGATRSYAGTPAAEAAGGEYTSFAFKIDARLDRSRFESWFRALPSGVLRLKGFVRFEGENGVFQVQVSRGQVSIAPFATDRWIDSALVAVTHPLPADALLSGLRDCVPQAGAVLQVEEEHA